MSLQRGVACGAATQGLKLLQGQSRGLAPTPRVLGRVAAAAAAPGTSASDSRRQLCCGAFGLATAAAVTAGRRRMGRGLPGVSRIARRDASIVSNLAPAETIFFRKENGPKVETSAVRPDQWRGGAIVLFVPALPEGEEGDLDLGRIGEAIDKELDGAIKELIKEEKFEAKEGSSKSCQFFGKDVKRVVLVGIGNKDKDEIDWRTAGAVAASELKAMKGGSSGLCCVDKMDVQAVVEGLVLGLHVDKRFRGSKTPEKEKEVAGPESVELLGAFPAGSDATIEKAQAVASGVIFARELVNGSPNYVNPPNLASAAEDLASKVGLTAKILDEAECEKLGMGSFLSVGRCSDLPSSLIHLTYKSDDEPTRKVGIVGKGLTFDAGGYNLKAGAGSMIEMMKFDMGGAASTLGAAASIAQLKPKGVEVHFVIATCENMISGNPGSLHPGDIITAMDGTTIEVNNTDAEGRLTLADALLYCQEQGVSEVVDIATLTGACMVALGDGIAGMWTNSDDMATNLEKSSKTANEKLWRMPLEESYWEGMKSEFADMKNTGPRFGGAITAALFLHKFVQKDVKWAHLDIAGTVWSDKPKTAFANASGGTGSMVRTLTELVKSG